VGLIIVMLEQNRAGRAQKVVIKTHTGFPRRAPGSSLSFVDTPCQYASR
jgi:hypothetical protein